jgi:hypothetical protein
MAAASEPAGAIWPIFLAIHFNHALRFQNALWPKERPWIAFEARVYQSTADMLRETWT